MRVIWTVSARIDVQGARQYIAQHDQNGARRVAMAIGVAVERIIEVPSLGHAGRVEGTRELVIPHTPYIVAYSVVGEYIVVLAVVHSAQEWPEVFE